MKASELIIKLGDLITDKNDPKIRFTIRYEDEDEGTSYEVTNIESANDGETVLLSNEYFR